MKRSLPLLLSAFWASAFFCSRVSAAEPGRAHVGTGPSFKGPIGLQRYSLRADFTNDVPGTLKKVESFGVRNVELAGTYNLPPEKFKEMLSARGLKAVSGHFPYDRYRNDAEGVAREA